LDAGNIISIKQLYANKYRPMQSKSFNKVGPAEIITHGDPERLREKMTESLFRKCEEVNKWRQIQIDAANAKRSH